LDVEPTVTLKAAGAAITTDTVHTGVSLRELGAAYWSDVRTPHGILEIAVHVTGCDAGNGDESYIIDALVDDVVALNDSPTKVGSLEVPRGFTGVLYLHVDARTIERADIESSGSDKFLGLRTDVGGTTPSISYSAHVVRTKGI
jgi:hypothetical protein